MRVVARDCTLEGQTSSVVGILPFIYRSVGAACISQMLWNRVATLAKGACSRASNGASVDRHFWLIIY